ncbi:HNH endonuclease [Aeromicrobium sp. Root344]|uniref:HNH endonuclease n=1 Tax=Aeromicrobium sp. Root344 TaxID=1736521 RepID=UPI00190FC575|nr:HNH endonuclease [Aeromicrobium sp. Root344]
MRQLIMDQLAKRTAESVTLTSAELSAFKVGDETIRLIDRGRGIWNPSAFDATLTIISDPSSEYDDGEIGDSLYRYSYQKGTEEGINTKLRKAIRLKVPIIMFRKIATSNFVPVFPVYVVEDDRPNRQFILALDESLRFLPNPTRLDSDQRRYAERVVRQRLHQPEFRAKVLLAYDTQCAVCVLKKGPLLDAAHITGDTESDGLPVVANGLALCKIHHSAYDANFLGISPDYVVHINAELLREVDGPMLKHGIQEMDSRNIVVPARLTDQPDRARLAARYEGFLAAG